jgi:hypothetical protein
MANPKVVNLDEPVRPPKVEEPTPRAPRETQAQAQESPQPTPAKLTPDEKKLAASISQVYQAVGAGCIGLGLRFQDEGLQGTGAQTFEMADALSVAWIDLARKNPKVKVWLKKVTEVSSVGVLVGMHLTILVPLLSSRGILPTGLIGGLNGQTQEPSPEGDTWIMNGQPLNGQSFA